MIGVRAAWRSAGLAAALAVCGCGHRTVQTYPPPPAIPGIGSAGNFSGESGGGRKIERQGNRSPTEPASSAAGEASATIPADARLLSTETGLASWYGPMYNGGRGANGEVFDQEALTAASRTLPLGVLARVTNLTDGGVAVVRITDRGPFIPGRIIDLSAGAAKAAGLYRAGVGKVRVEAFAPAGFVEVPAKWCVQIGAFVEREDAVQMKNDLLSRYPGAKVVSFQGPTGSWVRLTLGDPDMLASSDVAATVRVPDPGVGAYVTRIN